MTPVLTVFLVRPSMLDLFADPTPCKGPVTNYGEVGATKREGGEQVKFYPYEKGGGGHVENVLAMLKGGGEGHKHLWGSFHAVA